MTQKLPYLKLTVLSFICLLTSLAAQAQWTEKIGLARRGAAQSFALDGKLYVSGGYVGFTSGYEANTKAYDPSTNDWTNAKSPSTANRSGGVGFTINGKGYIALGQKNYLSFSPSPEDLLDMNEYDAKTNSWVSKAAFTGKGRVGSTVFVLNNIAYIVGGTITETDKATNEVWAYDPDADTWTQKADLPTSSAFASAFTQGALGYVTGGLGEAGTTLKSTYSYNPETDTWTAVSDLPKATAGGTAFTIGNYSYYCLGSDKDLGESGAKFPKALYRYDAESDAWTTSSLSWQNDGRLWPVSGVIDGKAYIGSGYKFDGGEFPYGDFFELDITLTSIKATPLQTITAFPNPANQQLNIQGFNSEGTLTIYNSQGKNVLTTHYEQNASVDISNLPEGVYQVSIQAPTAKYFTSLCIAH